MNPLFWSSRRYLIGIALSMASLVVLIGLVNLTSSLWFDAAGKPQLWPVLMALVVGLGTTEIEKRGVIPDNSVIAIIGKTFYIVGYLGLLRFVDRWPWYIGAPLAIAVLIFPMVAYRNRFFLVIHRLNDRDQTPV